jgi:hypothetical protein
LSRAEGADLGATGSIARHAIDLFPTQTDAQLRLCARNAQRLKKADSTKRSLSKLHDILGWRGGDVARSSSALTSNSCQPTGSPGRAPPSP